MGTAQTVSASGEDLPQTKATEEERGFLKAEVAPMGDPSVWPPYGI